MFKSTMGGQANRQSVRQMGLGVVAIGMLLMWLTGPLKAGLFDDQPSSPPASRPPRAGQTGAPAATSPAQPPAPPAPSGPTTAPSTTPPAPPAPEAPIPAAAEQKKAEKQVDEVLGAQVAKASSPEDYSKLAAMMLDTAASTAEPPSKFVLLRGAEEMAVRGGDTNALLAAYSALSRAFELNDPRIVIQPFQEMLRAAVSPDDYAKLCRGIVSAAEQAIADEQFESARQLGQLAADASQKLDDRDLSDRITALASALTAAEAEHRRIAPMRAVLAKRPDDPAANAAVGRYYCFVKHDWPRGLAMLAKGNDAVLKMLAQKELSAPADASRQLGLADSWWEYADSQRPEVRQCIRLHAGQWYAMASGKLTGLSKLKADERAADYLKSLPPSPKALATSPPGQGPEGFTSPQQVLASLPPDLFPKSIVDWDEDHRDAVNAALRKVLHKQATLTITVDEIPRSSSGRLLTHNQSVRMGYFVSTTRTSFDPAQQDQWPSIHVGGTYTVHGEIRSALFNGAEFYMYLVNCRIVPKE